MDLTQQKCLLFQFLKEPQVVMVQMVMMEPQVRLDPQQVSVRLLLQQGR